MPRDSWWLGRFEDSKCTCDILNKEGSAFNYFLTMLNRTSQMFEYDGLPDTIPAYMLELYLQLNGHVSITKVKGELYALPGNLGGPPDPYYRPTLYVVANPGLGFSASLKISNFLKPYDPTSTQGECVLIKNDTMAEGIYYLCTRFATQLAENDVSIRSAQINARHQVFIAASTDPELASANEYLAGIEAGKIGAVSSKAFLDGIKPANISVQSANTIIQLIELQQYLKASWFNEIGLNANFNMKREYLSEEELSATTDILLPLIDDMLRCREEALEAVNSLYGTNITVKKNSAWENKQKEVDTEHDIKEAEAGVEGGDSESESVPDDSEKSEADPD